MIKRLTGRKFKAALDVGTGEGWYMHALCSVAGEVVFTDPARPPASTLPLNATYMRVKVEDLPAEWAGRFDLITCISTLDHIGLDAYGLAGQEDDLFCAAQALATMTASGGTLLLTVPVGRDMITTHGNHGGQRVLSFQTLRNLFPRRAWKVEDMRFWRLAGNEYELCEWRDVADTGYAGHRAYGVVAVEFHRKGA